MSINTHAHSRAQAHTHKHMYTNVCKPTSEYIYHVASRIWTTRGWNLDSNPYDCQNFSKGFDPNHRSLRSGLYEGRDSFIRGTWRIHMRIHMCIGTHSYVWHDIWVKSPEWMRYDLFICGMWLNHAWDMTDSFVRHDSCICVTWCLGHVAQTNATW